VDLELISFSRMTVLATLFRIAEWRVYAFSTLSPGHHSEGDNMKPTYAIRPRSLALIAARAAILLLAALSSAQTYTALYTFPETACNTTGIGAPEVIAQGRDGNLYSATNCGGTDQDGYAYKITPTGTLNTVYNFTNGTTTGVPHGGVALGLDGNFYGTTVGYAFTNGSIFKLTSSGTLTTICDLTTTNCGAGADGAAPVWAVFPYEGQDGSLYSVGQLGGGTGHGTLYKISAAGKISLIYSFCALAGCDDGADPNVPAQYVDGNFYGTTIFGGTSNLGILYKITPTGKLTVLHNFAGGTADGAYPQGVLTEGNDGNFYGVTNAGGTFNLGTIFKITPSGKETILYNFDGTHGSLPGAGLTAASDGNLYGVTANGGTTNTGVIFEITLAGVETTLYNFGSDGFFATLPLTQHTNGTFYGATSGNSLGGGVFYSFNTGLSPFVGLVNWTDKVGKTVNVIGQGFTGTTGVSFNGVPATFKNSSDTFLTATVPAGALTGPITVTTFTNSYKSNRQFLVTPQLTSLSVSSAIVGQSITLTGVSLTQTIKVVIGGLSATFSVNSDTQVTATVPAGAKTGKKVSITTLGGTATSSTALAIAPSNITFTPTSGAPGTSVTITGNSFTGATKVTFGGVAATSYQVINDTQVDALVPTGAKTGPVAVTTAGGTGTSTTSFTVTQ
jgi:uncharacterized repeat protein (TIGR03803 family)